MQINFKIIGSDWKITTDHLNGTDYVEEDKELFLGYIGVENGDISWFDFWLNETTLLEEGNSMNEYGLMAGDTITIKFKSLYVLFKDMNYEIIPSVYDASFFQCVAHTNARTSWFTETEMQNFVFSINGENINKNEDWKTVYAMNGSHTVVGKSDPVVVPTTQQTLVPLWLVVGLPAVSLLGIFFLLFFIIWKKRKHDDKEEKKATKKKPVAKKNKKSKA